MVSTRRAQSSATPPTTPSAARHVEAPQSAPGSGKKMSKELRRLTIDANPSLGGVATTSPAKRKRRRSGVRQEVVHDQTERQAQADGSQDQAPSQLLPDGGVLLTPSPSDSPDSPHVPSTNDAAPSQPCLERQITPLAVKDSQPIAQSSSLQPASPSDQSPALATRAAGKRKITQYFTAVSAQDKANKRRKINGPPSLHKTTSVPESSLAPPTTLSTAASAPELKSEETKELETTSQTPVDQVVLESVVKAVQTRPEEKEPDKPQDTDREHEQQYHTAEEGHSNKEDLAKREEDEKKALKRERELKKLQIDAKPALIDKRSRRQTTLPPARIDDDEDARSAKRQRMSLPASGIADPLSSTPARAKEEVPAKEIPTIAEALATPPEPNPPVFPAGTDPKLLASGEVNDKWLTKWLGYVAHITGDEDTSKILTEEDATHLVKPDRSQETSQDRQKRISGELDTIATWDVMAPQQEATQSSPEQAPIKPLIKKKKQRFNPKPKGQPYIPKAKKRAQELAALKAKKKAEVEAGAGSVVAAEATSVQRVAPEPMQPAVMPRPEQKTEAEKEVEPVQRSTPHVPPPVQEDEVATDWLTDLMNTTETIFQADEQTKKTKRGSKGKGKAKAA
ncbi:hypothetical protein AUEXF2481DRAFT_43966 [Aureobasidium subglaciale EXF-2481]|uniref:Uncharacterized protein n=1 Tax=Aureobasidium subglaciale (strain EXF-2481) TaxID=1043005 RepID=A0A074Y1C4_AURSE|nr:uncharacterized protein AUEXF2481DRAFT_43966 [Aureobasidium subglaciale EXF-2481]KAI5200385.1 hypothetical protein E4T38_06570 [Aureobasidium subglaciale]KAI5218964.1 hypothetical protein E4T40_06689 [Aureobasidium subglaciale]KAI5222645.1 hypothetical protein E4T41_06510 [Aureobasidium subglaciale]KAI5260219.1 hypothetical protein E4T46_06222 [Aureobasidium subglaciale]KEQ91588.1 hypothetical protein AUEXF2481DRAFT_43966 [Aureobasidium subglaciale EXF-2481]